MKADFIIEHMKKTNKPVTPNTSIKYMLYEWSTAA
jgi:hypothetical protein